MEVRPNNLTRIAPLLLLVVGCSVGEVPIGGETANTPDAAANNNNNDNNNNDNPADTANTASFDAQMKPVIAARNCGGCHAGAQPPNLSSYAGLEPKYKMKPGSANVLVTKGDHAGIQYWDAAQKMTVQNWIDGLQ